jgi:hypothetical protein
MYHLFKYAKIAYTNSKQKQNENLSKIKWPHILLQKALYPPLASCSFQS